MTVYKDEGAERTDTALSVYERYSGGNWLSMMMFRKAKIIRIDDAY